MHIEFLLGGHAIEQCAHWRGCRLLVQETELKGILQLKGARVGINKRMFHFNLGSSGFAFDVNTASDGEHSSSAMAATPEPTHSDVTPIGGEAPSVAALSTGGVAAGTNGSSGSDACHISASGEVRIVDSGTLERHGSSPLRTASSSVSRTSLLVGHSPLGLFKSHSSAQVVGATLPLTHRSQLDLTSSGPAAGDGEGSVPRAVRRTSTVAIASEGLPSHASSSSATLNPLHASKRNYVWVCDTREEREEWLQALNAAILEATSEAECLAWGRRFSMCKALGEYEASLTALRYTHAPLYVSADWVRVHMAASHRRAPCSADMSGVSLPDGGPPRPLVHMPLEAAREPLLTVASPRNKKLMRVLMHRDRDVKETRFAATKSNSVKYSARAEEAEFMREDAVTAVASAEASNYRRRAGVTPGDRVSLRQLGRDTQRDVVVLDGTHLPTVDITEVIIRVAARVVQVLNDAFAAMYAEQRGDSIPPPLSKILTLSTAHTGPASCNPKGWEMQLLEFVREVLTCTSRTVMGGDTFDALELIFANRECAHLKPDTEGRPSPIDLSVDLRSASGHSYISSLASGAGGGGVGISSSTDESDSRPTPDESDSRPTPDEASHLRAVSDGSAAVFSDDDATCCDSDGAASQDSTFRDVGSRRSSGPKRHKASADSTGSGLTQILRLDDTPTTGASVNGDFTALQTVSSSTSDARRPSSITLLPPALPLPAPTTTPLWDVSALPVVSTAAGYLPLLALRVRCDMRYQLLAMSSGEEGEEGSAAPTGTLATLVGSYARAFPWAGPAPSASITVRVEDGSASPA